MRIKDDKLRGFQKTLSLAFFLVNNHKEMIIIDMTIFATQYVTFPKANRIEKIRLSLIISVYYMAGFFSKLTLRHVRLPK